MIYSIQLHNEAQHRIDGIFKAEYAEARRLTRHHRLIAKAEAESVLQRDIAPLLSDGETTGGHDIIGWLHNIIPLKGLAGRTLPAIAGLHRIGEHDEAYELTRQWQKWVDSFYAIVARCPRELPENDRSALTIELATEAEQLFQIIALRL